MTAPPSRGYATGTLPLRTVTVRTGQKLLFDRISKELWPNPNPAKVTYQNYGVEVPTKPSLHGQLASYQPQK